MDNIFLILFIILVLFLFIEITLRFKKIIYMPLKFKLFYCLFLLGKKTFIERYVICQRVHRGGFKNLDDLMQHYSKISNLSINQIYKKFIPNKVSNVYHSGALGLLNETLDAKLGYYRPIPNQKLKTLNINELGLRKTLNVKNYLKKKEKKIFFFGGSIMFGVGSTGDEKTIPSIISDYLNSNKKAKFYYNCQNYAYLRDDSSKEIIKLTTNKDKPDIIVSLGGYNDIVNKLWQTFNISERPIYSFFKKFLILRAINRFFLAYKNYDLINDCPKDNQNIH